MENAEHILVNLSEKGLIEKFYDEEYQEDRYALKKNRLELVNIRILFVQ